MKYAAVRRRKNDICAFAAVILYVDEHIGEELRSEDAAERIGMSRSYFSTRFKEMTEKHSISM